MDYHILKYEDYHMITTDKGKDKKAVRSYPPIFETAKVKVYQSKTGKGYKTQKKIINLSVKSSFEDMDEIIILHAKDFYDMLEDPETPSLEDLETLENEKRQYVEKSEDLEKQVYDLERENKELNKKIIEILEHKEDQAQALREDLEDLRAVNKQLENNNKSLELEYNELNQINQNNIKNILNNAPVIIEDLANQILNLTNKEIKKRGYLARLRNETIEINDSQIKENTKDRLINQLHLMELQEGKQ